MTTPGPGRTRTARGALVAALLVAPLAGCGGEIGIGGGGGGESYDCLGTRIPAAALTEARTAETLDEQNAAALDGLEVPSIDPADWTVVSESKDEVVLLRELDEPEHLGSPGDVRTHERIVISVVDAPNVPDSPAWMMTALGSCALVVDVPGAGTATVALDPDALPDPASTDVPLLVTEFACNSGRPADGRVEVASLRETETTVEVVMAVRPQGGDHACPSNPPTPYTLTLDEPLGDRELLDASVVPMRTLEAAVLDW